MRTMEDNLEESKNTQIRQTCDEISRKCSFLHTFPDELNDKDLYLLNRINDDVDVLYRAVFRRMHTESEKE